MISSAWGKMMMLSVNDALIELEVDPEKTILGQLMEAVKGKIKTVYPGWEKMDKNLRKVVCIINIEGHMICPPNLWWEEEMKWCKFKRMWGNIVFLHQEKHGGEFNGLTDEEKEALEGLFWHKPKVYTTEHTEIWGMAMRMKGLRPGPERDAGVYRPGPPTEDELMEARKKMIEEGMI